MKIIKIKRRIPDPQKIAKLSMIELGEFYLIVIKKKERRLKYEKNNKSNMEN